MNEKKKKKTKADFKKDLGGFNKYIRYMGLAFEMAAIIGGGTYLGVWLDKKFNSNETPYFTIVLSLFAVFASTYLIIKQILNDK